MTHNQRTQPDRLFIGLALLFGTVFVPSHSVSAADWMIESGDYRIEMIKEKGKTSKDVDETLSIEVTDRRTQIRRRLEVAPLVESVSDILVVAESRLFVSARIRHGAEAFSLTDLETGQRQPSFRGFDSSLSPSGRYLAYVSYHPRMVASAYRRSILLICDFEKDAKKHTPGYIEALPHTDTMSGVPAFPERNAYERSYDVLLDDEYHFQSPLLWSKDEKTLVFFATNADEREFYIVRVDLAAGIDHPQVAKKRIILGPHIDHGKLLPVEVDRLKNKLPFIIGETLWWSGSNRVTIQTSADTYFHNREMEFSLPIFQEQ